LFDDDVQESDCDHDGDDDGDDDDDNERSWRSVLVGVQDMIESVR
jgi:hypothetical protein